MLLLVVLVGPYFLWPPHVTGSPAVAVKFLSPRLTRYLLILFPSSITSLCPPTTGTRFLQQQLQKAPESSSFSRLWLFFSSRCRGDVRPPPARSRLAGTARKQLLASGDQRDPSSSSEIQVEPRRRLYNRGGQLIIILLHGCSVLGAGGSVCRDSLRTSAVICNYLCGVSLFSP